MHPSNDWISVIFSPKPYIVDDPWNWIHYVFFFLSFNEIICIISKGIDYLYFLSSVFDNNQMNTIKKPSKSLTTECGTNDKKNQNHWYDQRIQLQSDIIIMCITVGSSNRTNDWRVIINIHIIIYAPAMTWISQSEQKRPMNAKRNLIISFTCIHICIAHCI